MLSVPAWAWVVWAALSLAVFAVLEFIALANNHEKDTLSENLRRWLGLDPPRRIRQWAVPLFITVMVGFVVWAVPHIVLSIW